MCRYVWNILASIGFTSKIQGIRAQLWISSEKGTESVAVSLQLGIGLGLGLGLSLVAESVAVSLCLRHVVPAA